MCCVCVYVCTAVWEYAACVRIYVCGGYRQRVVCVCLTVCACVFNHLDTSLRIPLLLSVGSLIAAVETDITKSDTLCLFFTILP